MRLMNKYLAKRSKSEDGVSFPSKIERAVYEYLKRLKEEGRVVLFLRQVGFDIPGKARHFVDFEVITDDEVLFVECKGRDLPLGKLKREQTEELYGIDIHVVTSTSDLKKLLEKDKNEIN